MQNNLYIPIDTTIYNPVDCEKLVKRGDTITLTVKVFTNGVLADLTGQTVDIILTKADGTAIQHTLDASNISNGVITAQLEQQATVVAGPVNGEFQIYTTGTLKSTNTFTFNVDTSLADNVIEISQNDISLLNDVRQTIANGEMEILQYKDHILAIANSIEAIEALENIKSYIGTNLPALENNNAQAVVNNNNLQNSITSGTSLKNSLDEFINSHADVTGISNQLSVINSSLSEKANQSDIDKQLSADITKYGAVGDGVTNCFSIFNTLSASIPATIDNIEERIINRFFNYNVNGIANGWIDYTDPGITGTLSINNGQTAEITASTQKGGRAVYQDIPVKAGEVITFKVKYNSIAYTGGFGVAILPVALDYDGTTIQEFDAVYPSNTTSDAVCTVGSYTIPTLATKIRLYLMAYANTAGDTGVTTFKQVEMTKVGAKSKAILFPQNDDKNAVYYFSSAPSLDGVVIAADENVTLSFPTTNAISFKKAIFRNDIEIISRDRDNIGKQLKNNISDLCYYSLIDNDQRIGIKKISRILDANVSKKIYTAEATYINPATLSIDADDMYYMANAGDIDNRLQRVVTTEFPFTPNYLYNCDFEFNVPETNTNAAIGITTTTEAGDWLFWFMRYDGHTACVQNVGGVFGGVTPTRDVKSLLTDAYKPNKGFILGVKPIANNKIKIFINGFYVDTIQVPFVYTKVGFGMITVNAENQGLQNTKWGRIVCGLCEKDNYGDVLKIATFGDSITFGEGSISWAEYLPKLLKGQRGISDVYVLNKAFSGNTTAEQLYTMQNTGLTGYNAACIMIGTNDIQTELALATYKSNLQSMINIAKTAGCKVILGIPPMWIDETLTGRGVAVAHYADGAAYRSTVMKLAADNDIYIADTLSEIGRIANDTVMNLLRDNLHPNEFGQVQLARCFARSIIEAVMQD